MNAIFKIDSPVLKFGIATIAALMLAACGGSGSGGDSALPAGEAVAAYELPGDHAIGSKDAQVVVAEYASVVCPACANWHNTVYPEFKKKYVETGKVRFIFREFPTSPPRLAQTGFAIANCVGEDKFMSNISTQFKRQDAILRAPDKAKVYEDLAKASGLSASEYDACINDQEWIAEYKDKIKAAREKGVRSTPTFFINGKQQKVFTVEDFDKVIGPLLGAAAEEKAE